MTSFLIGIIIGVIIILLIIFRKQVKNFFTKIIDKIKSLKKKK